LVLQNESREQEKGSVQRDGRAVDGGGRGALRPVNGPQTNCVQPRNVVVTAGGVANRLTADLPISSNQSDRSLHQTKRLSTDDCMIETGAHMKKQRVSAPAVVVPYQNELDGLDFDDDFDEEFELTTPQRVLAPTPLRGQPPAQKRGLPSLTKSNEVSYNCQKLLNTSTAHGMSSAKSHPRLSDESIQQMLEDKNHSVQEIQSNFYDRNKPDKPEIVNRNKPDKPEIVNRNLLKNVSRKTEDELNDEPFVHIDTALRARDAGRKCERINIKVCLYQLSWDLSWDRY